MTERTAGMWAMPCGWYRALMMCSMALGTRRAVSRVVRKVLVTGDVRSLRCSRSAGVCLSAGGSNGVGRCAVLSSLGVIGAMMCVSLTVGGIQQGMQSRVVRCGVADDGMSRGCDNKSGSRAGDEPGVRSTVKQRRRIKGEAEGLLIGL